MRRWAPVVIRRRLGRGRLRWVLACKLRRGLVVGAGAAGERVGGLCAPALSRVICSPCWVRVPRAWWGVFCLLVGARVFFVGARVFFVGARVGVWWCLFAACGVVVPVRCCVCLCWFVCLRVWLVLVCVGCVVWCLFVRFLSPVFPRGCFLSMRVFRACGAVFSPSARFCLPRVRFSFWVIPPVCPVKVFVAIVGFVALSLIFPVSFLTRVRVGGGVLPLGWGWVLVPVAAPHPLGAPVCVCVALWGCGWHMGACGA